MLLQTITNHPVHIYTEYDEFSPSSFIPFCSFGEEFIGANLSGFDIPVCNIFKPRNYLDQFCYETDLHELKHNQSQKLGKQLELGLTLVLDYNEETQNYFKISKNDSNRMKAFYHNNDNDISIYLDAIG